MTTFRGCSRLGAAILIAVGVGAYVVGGWIAAAVPLVLAAIDISPVLWAWWRGGMHEPDDTDYSGFQ